MKKIIYLVGIVFIIFTILSSFSHTFAATLDNLNVEVSKTKIAPGEQVTVTADFGTSLGAYTMDVEYDNNIFEYVSAEGGTANDDGTRVRLTFYDETGGNNPRTSASITFKAIETITSSNPTDFIIVLEGLANPDASETYTDVNTQKDVLVEPTYVDYTLSLDYTGDITPLLIKEMTLTTASKMGKNYDSVEVAVGVTKAPENGEVQLLATKTDDTEIDLIKEPWGEYSLGGKDVLQTLELRAIFSEVGDYTLDFSVIDLDSNTAIASKSFDFNVKGASTENNNAGTNNEQENTEEDLPETLPKTGGMQYVFIILAIASLAFSYYIITKKKQK